MFRKSSIEQGRAVGTHNSVTVFAANLRGVAYQPSTGGGEGGRERNEGEREGGEGKESCKQNSIYIHAHVYTCTLQLHTWILIIVPILLQVSKICKMLFGFNNMSLLIRLSIALHYHLLAAH